MSYRCAISWLLCVTQDEENLQRAHNEVPTDDELNCRLARSPAELATFRAIDAEMDTVSNPMGKPAHLHSMTLAISISSEVSTGLLRPCS